MNRLLAAERRACELAASVGDHFIHIHVELGAAAGHPDVQRKHVVMLAVEDFIADLNDQLVRLVIEPFAGSIYVGGCLFQDRVGRDHFARYQILADAEMLERALCLRSPEFVGGDVDLAKAIHLFANVASHVSDLLETHVEPRRNNWMPSALKADPDPLCALACSMRALSDGYKRPALPYDRLCKSAL